MMKLGIALGALVLVVGCSKPAPPKGITAAEAARRCPQGWTQRASKWVCRDPRAQEIYYSRIPTQFLADVR